MTPKERYDKIYDRTFRLAEEADSDDISPLGFMPKAIDEEIRCAKADALREIAVAFEGVGTVSYCEVRLTLKRAALALEK